MLRYAITDRRSLALHEADCADALVVQAAWLAARGDIDYLQLREKDLPSAALAAMAHRMLETLCAYAPDPEHRVKLLINSRVDVAIAVRADGVHLTSSPGELMPAQVRRLYAAAGLPTPIVSLSCHTLDEVAAQVGGAVIQNASSRSDLKAAPDLILFGPVFEKRISDQVVKQGSGLELLRHACAVAAPIPVLALGGITEENAADCLAAGAEGASGIRLFQ